MLYIYEVIISDNIGSIVLFEADSKFPKIICFGVILMKIEETLGVLPQE